MMDQAYIFGMAMDDFDLNDMLRRMSRDAILKAYGERTAFSPDSEDYQVLSRLMDELQKSLAYLRYKDPR